MDQDDISDMIDDTEVMEKMSYFEYYQIKMLININKNLETLTEAVQLGLREVAGTILDK